MIHLRYTINGLKFRRTYRCALQADRRIVILRQQGIEVFVKVSA